MSAFEASGVRRLSLRSMLIFVAVLGVCFALIVWCRNSGDFGSSAMPRLLPASVGSAFAGIFLAPVAYAATIVGMLVHAFRTAKPLFASAGFGIFAVGAAVAAFVPPLPADTSGLEVTARVVLVLGCFVPLIVAEACFRRSTRQLTVLLPCATGACISAYMFWWGAEVSASV